MTLVPQSTPLAESDYLPGDYFFLGPEEPLEEAEIQRVLERGKSVALTGQIERANRGAGQWSLLTEDGMETGKTTPRGPSLDGLQVGKRYHFQCAEVTELDPLWRDQRTLYLQSIETARTAGTPCSDKRAFDTQEVIKCARGPFPAEIQGVLLRLPNGNTSPDCYAKWRAIAVVPALRRRFYSRSRMMTPARSAGSSRPGTMKVSLTDGDTGRPVGRGGRLFAGNPSGLRHRLRDNELKPRAYNVAGFDDPDHFKDQMDEWLRMMKSTRPAPGEERVLVAGKPEAEMEEIRRVEGIPLHQEVVDWFHDTCGELGIDCPF